MPSLESAKLYGRWLGMWNGDLSLARDVVAPDCVVHQPGVPPNRKGDADGIERLTAFVQQSRAPFERLVFSLEIGPIEEADKLVARWTARGAYAGGLPGATAATGTLVEFAGVDVCRLADGKVAEYWPTTDGVHLLQQLGAVPVEAPPQLPASA